MKTSERLKHWENMSPMEFVAVQKEVALLEDVVEGVKKLKEILGPDGEYSIGRGDREKMNIGDVMFVGGVLEKIDDALAKLENTNEQ